MNDPENSRHTSLRKGRHAFFIFSRKSYVYLKEGGNMTSEEIVRAMKSAAPVVCNGIRYLRIEQYVLWIDRNSNRQMRSVDLVDANDRTLVRVPADRVAAA